MAKKTKTVKEQNPVTRDILLLIILAVSVLLFISTLGFCGIVGVGLRFALFGLFGLPAYALPFLLFFIGAYLLANRKNPVVIRAFVGLGGFYLFVCGFCQLVMAGYDAGHSIFQCFLDSADSRMGGGFFGGVLVQLFGMLLGVIGTYVVLIIGMFIFAILLTQKPLVSKMKDDTQVIYRKAKDSHTQAIARRQERETQRIELPEKIEEAAEPKPRRKRKKEEVPEVRSQEKQNAAGAEPDIFDDYLSGKFDLKKVAQQQEESSAVNMRKEPEFVLPELELPEGIFDEPEEESPEELQGSGDAEISAVPEKSQPREDDSKEKVTVPAELSQKMENKAPNGYRLPPVSLLNKGNSGNTREMNAHVRETAVKLQQTLHNFGVEATVINASCGPTVTRYELQPEQGVKVSRIVSLTDDIKLNLAAADIRIEAPIPGKAAVGIEVPNKTNNSVALRELIDTPEFKNNRSKLSFAVGKDLAGKPVISDIAKMPHLLIAGSTGSGKSVCINTLIMSLIYKARPDEVKLMMIDPKVVELSIYNGIPHLLCPVVTDPKKAAGALQWAVVEMTRRYNLFAEFSVRDLAGYNKKAAELARYANEEEAPPEILPQIVIIVDELADLMMAAPGEVEDAICRLAQLARAAGLHLIIATQRPSVNVITGLIKANMPSRIALSVTSGIDSRVIIDMNGAEKLLGKGDMLFYPAGYQKPARVQGGYVSDEEIQKVVDYISKEEVVYDSSVQEVIDSTPIAQDAPAGAALSDERDVYFTDAGKFIIEKDKASIGMLQRVFRIGFNRAARIMDQLCEAGVVGEEEGTKPRKILMSMEQFENYLEEN